MNLGGNKMSDNGNKKSTLKEQAALLLMLEEKLEIMEAEITTLRAAKAPPAKVVRPSTAGKPRENTSYALIKIPEKGFPPQAVTCCKILEMAVDQTNISEKEAMELFETHKGLLKTRQPAWKVFAFYKARLVSGNYIAMS
jgi:hypothetical protein